MNKFCIVKFDCGDEDKKVIVYDVWDKNLNIIVSTHTSRELAWQWVKENGGQIEGYENLMLETMV